MAAHTGLRLGELRALQWKHIDLAERMLIVEQSASKTNNTLGPPKSGKPRPVPITSELLAALRVLASRYGSAGEQFLFSDDGTAPLYTNVFYRCLRHAYEWEIEQPLPEGLRYHSFRRYFITMLRTAHVPDAAIAVMVGHESREVTDLYDRRTIREQATAFDSHVDGISAVLSVSDVFLLIGGLQVSVEWLVNEAIGQPPSRP